VNIDRAEKYRLQKWRDQNLGTNIGDPYGMFEAKGLLIMVAPIDLDWEHVSVSRKHRIPRWEEMCFVKDLFWDEEETVVQFHPRKTEYKNVHPYCLHLWRRKDLIYELPPLFMV